MPTTDKLIELFRAIATEDIARATIIATQVCKSEEQRGHRTAARLLRGALAANGHLTGAPTSRSPTIGNANIVSTALVRLSGEVRMPDITLTQSVGRELQNLILEWKHRDRLKKRGISPRSKLLFHGPPGCGKSLTAQALGQELGIPVYMVRFDAVIGAYLGQTALHLRQLFHFAETTPSILLLDELDALGKKRGNPLDVGELDRIVISLMQELEHSRPMGIIVGTSNLPKHLDDALWRRFDLDLYFGRPTKNVLRDFVRRLARKKRVSIPPALMRRAQNSESFARAESMVNSELRRQALLSI